MTTFEQYLIDKGYVRYKISNHSYVIPKYHSFSTMGDLSYIYFPKEVAEKIMPGNIIAEMDREEWGKQVSFGLHEKGKPPTLIYPRPRINLRVIHNDRVFILDEQFDDIMNRALDEFTMDEIYAAMLDKEILLRLKSTDDDLALLKSIIHID